MEGLGRGERRGEGRGERGEGRGERGERRGNNYHQRGRIRPSVVLEGDVTDMNTG
jgi:hypothetical protein